MPLQHGTDDSRPHPPNMPEVQRPASKDMANRRNPSDKALRQPRGYPENCCLRPRDWCGHLNEANEEEEEKETWHADCLGHDNASYVNDIDRALHSM